MKWTVCLLVLLAAMPAVAQYGSRYGWQKVDTLTSGNCDDFTPRIAANADNWLNTAPTWVVFRRVENRISLIEGTRFVANESGWEGKVYTISSDSPGVLRSMPDICTTVSYTYMDSVSHKRAFTVAAWQEKSDGAWNIYYSTCDADSANWTDPAAVTKDSVDNTDPEVRVLSDTSIVLVWKTGSAIQYSIATAHGVSQPRRLVNSNFDSTQFDIQPSYSGMNLVWTDENADSTTSCIIADVAVADSLTVSLTDAIVMVGDIERPRFMVSYSPTFTFNLLDSGKYEAWVAYEDVYSAGWQAELASGSSTSDNLNLVYYNPPVVTVVVRGIRKSTQSPPPGFSVWERRNGSDTTLIFGTGYYNDTLDTPGSNSNPSISRSTCGFGSTIDGSSYIIGLTVFESDRTGRSHIYARAFHFTIGAVYYPPGPPVNFALYQNYPNPFNPTTTIRFTVRSSAFVVLSVYDLLGRLVKTLVDSRLAAGEHSVVFDGRGLASGVYFYRLTAGGLAQVRKMLLVK